MPLPPELDPKVVADIIAGCLGGVLRWIAAKLSLREGILAVCAGGILGGYMANIGDALAGFLFAPVLGSGGALQLGVGGLVMGVMGVTVPEYILRGAKAVLQPKDKQP